jgi:hypothetical protein
MIGNLFSDGTLMVPCCFVVSIEKKSLARSLFKGRATEKMSVALN